MKKNIKIGLGIVGLFLLLLAWFFRPFFHEVVIYFYANGILSLLLVLFIGTITFLLKKKIPLQKNKKVHARKKSYSAANSLPGLILIGILIAGIILYAFSITILIWTILLAGVWYFFYKKKIKGRAIVVIFYFLMIFVLYFEPELAHLITSKEINFEQREDFPEIKTIRILPKLVATRYAEDSLQNPQEMLGDSQIVMVDNKLMRVFPRLPNSKYLYFTSKLSGFVTIEVSALEKHARIENQEFTYSEGIGVLDNLYYQLNKNKYFVQYSDPIYLKDPQTSQWITVVPYIGYRYFPFQIPYWAGFFTVDSKGIMIDHKPEEAVLLPLTKGNRVFPTELTRYYTESYAYKQGLINKWFIHKNHPLIDEEEYWPQPFHLPTVEGYKQVIFTRPFGNSYGIFKIFIFDATSGKKEVIEYDLNTLLIGPVASKDYVAKEFPTLDYNEFIILEPRPVTVDEELYWLMSIVDYSGAGVSKTIVVNTRTGKAIELKSIEEIESFVLNKQLSVENSLKTEQKGESVDAATVINKLKEIKDKLVLLEQELDYLSERLKKEVN
ncbi:hypothetical protein HYX12_04700 [Candidatus Woesearchaeota archaeon]|nr:hypothetical protein [Candidatus Woesearchaeota archaeon]